MVTTRAPALVSLKRKLDGGAMVNSTSVRSLRWYLSCSLPTFSLRYGFFTFQLTVHVADVASVSSAGVGGEARGRDRLRQSLRGRRHRQPAKEVRDFGVFALHTASREMSASQTRRCE